jgi:hypothetical protein
LNAVESLQGVPFLATGKHLCAAATGNLCNLNMHSDEIHSDVLFFLVTWHSDVLLMKT